jgi:lipopolysaccharide assembly protein A
MPALNPGTCMDCRVKPGDNDVKIFYWFITLVVAALAAIFAVTNREIVTVSLWPFPSVPMRLYLVVLVAMLAGFLIGEFVAWLYGGRVRRLARERARRIAALERELAATQAMTAPQGTAVAKATAPQIAKPG